MALKNNPILQRSNILEKIDDILHVQLTSTRKIVEHKSLHTDHEKVTVTQKLAKN
jgi:hypothetical protein